LNAGGITDAYIRYNFSKPFSIKVGAFKEPFSLEEATSNRYLTFIERNMSVNAFVDNLNTYKVGIGANYWTDRWLVASSFQTEGVGGFNNAYGSNNIPDSTGSAVNVNGGVNRNGGGGDTSYEFNTRLAGTPWFESKTKFLHTGFSGSYININNNYKQNGTYNNGGVIIASALGANVDRSGILNTANLTHTTALAPGLRKEQQASSLSRFGVESALVYGPFSAQAEYIVMNVYGKGYSGSSIDGAYGYMTYFLTGESRNYKTNTAAWDRIKPNHNFDLKGGWGAWELAAGYDYLNLNSTGIQGGKASNIRFGLNWYPHSHLRVNADYVHVLNVNTANAATAFGRAWNDASLDMIETRVQVDW
jgi:phosphate-selective porin OprO/OprP